MSISQFYSLCQGRVISTLRYCQEAAVFNRFKVKGSVKGMIQVFYPNNIEYTQLSKNISTILSSYVRCAFR